MKRSVRKEGGLSIFLSSLAGNSPSDAILRQESRGQSSFVNSDTLPKKCDRQALEALGVVFGDDADDLFVFVTLPDGWKKEPTEHSMWSRLVDGSGFEVASIFYKAAFYDRDAFVSMKK